MGLYNSVALIVQKLRHPNWVLRWAKRVVSLLLGLSRFDSGVGRDGEECDVELGLGQCYKGCKEIRVLKLQVQTDKIIILY